MFNAIRRGQHRFWSNAASGRDALIEADPDITFSGYYGPSDWMGFASTGAGLIGTMSNRG